MHNYRKHSARCTPHRRARTQRKAAVFTATPATAPAPRLHPDAPRPQGGPLRPKVFFIVFLLAGALYWGAL